MSTLQAQPGSLSREPADYRETEHFPECFDDPLRFITPEMVEQTIIRGRDYPDQGGPGKIRRKFEYDGVDAVLVIADDEPVLITGWTEIRSHVRALASDRWSQDDLARIRAFMDRKHKLPPGEIA